MKTIVVACVLLSMAACEGMAPGSLTTPAVCETGGVSDCQPIAGQIVWACPDGFTLRESTCAASGYEQALPPGGNCPDGWTAWINSCYLVTQ